MLKWVWKVKVPVAVLALNLFSFRQVLNFIDFCGLIVAARSTGHTLPLAQNRAGQASAKLGW